MKKKVLIGGALALVAGIGLYKMMNQKQNGYHSSDSLNTSGEKWTTADMPDLTGKVIIVTGGNSGIGFESAKEFARKGAETILACRSISKAKAALAEIQTEIPNAPAVIMELDLASLASVRKFANEFKKKYTRLDILVNNAGIMMVPYQTTEDGFESQFGTNHLGHFALTGLLIDLLLNTPGARVVNISSNGHRMGKIDFDNLMYADGEGYSPTKSYGRSKLANLLFTYELQRYFKQSGVDAIAVAAHPGGSVTNLGNHLEENMLFKAFNTLFKKMAQSAAMGTLPTIRAAVDPNMRGGEYFGPEGFMELGGYPVVVQSNQASHNAADACKLWQISEELTGVRFRQVATSK